MYILSLNMWFQKLMRQFFFNIDKVVYDFISQLYDLLISISRTSVFTQADIIKFSDKIYKLLAVFMIFKVTFSLIMYVVNPDDFSDKSKGISKLGTNIVISLCMLILTPYVFNYAYQLQTMVLESNILGKIIFESSKDNDYLNTAGNSMSFITISAFFTPDVSIDELHPCTTIVDLDTKKFNAECKGTANTGLLSLTDDKTFNETWLNNYIAGIENSSMGLTFRQNLAIATSKKGTLKEETFIMDYKYIFSTVVGVVIVLLLITFCMDVALRSIKLGALQLIAPIPIVSYVDPKSGKDGLFKKWYQMCLKTFLSLFIRLIALYFAIYIISIVADRKLVDIVDGSYQTNTFIQIFIIIGSLMFAKQLPKMLEGLGVKLDGNGFSLNPLKKLENEAFGGKNITGAAAGAMTGFLGNKGARRLSGMLGGVARGGLEGKGFKEAQKRQADVNRKLREARINGANFIGARKQAFDARFGADDHELEGESRFIAQQKKNVELKRRETDDRVKAKEVEKKQIQDEISDKKQEISNHKKMQDSIAKMEERAKTEIQNGNGGSIGKEYLTRKATAEYYRNNIGKNVSVNGKSVEVTSEMVAEADQSVSKWLNDEGMKKYMSEASTGTFDDGTDDKTFQNSYKNYEESTSYLGINSTTDGTEIHSQYGKSKGTVGEIEREIDPKERDIGKIDDTIRSIQVEKNIEIDGVQYTIEEAEQLIKKRESELKDKKDQNKTDRDKAASQKIEPHIDGLGGK